MEIKLAGTINDSIVDGPGFRYTIFVQGCPHKCEGCHNPETHDFNGGKVSDTDTLVTAIKGNPLLDGVTFSGGEPFCQTKPLVFLAQQIRELNGLDIVSYTGYTFEYLTEHSNEENGYLKLLSLCDYLVDGKFEQDKKSYELRFRGSTNQRIIDVKKSLQGNKVVLTDF